jgi:hypothetical protein
MDQNDRKRRQVQRMAETIQPLQPAKNHPGPGRGHTKKPDEKARAGNRSDYLAARIARDRPDILERMKAGEFTSVREAAREAGIIKDVSAGHADCTAVGEGHPKGTASNPSTAGHRRRLATKEKDKDHEPVWPRLTGFCVCLALPRCPQLRLRRCGA